MRLAANADDADCWLEMSRANWRYEKCKLQRNRQTGSDAPAGDGTVQAAGGVGGGAAAAEAAGSVLGDGEKVVEEAGVEVDEGVALPAGHSEAGC